MLSEIHTSFPLVNISDTPFFSVNDLPDRGFLTNLDIFEDNFFKNLSPKMSKFVRNPLSGKSLMEKNGI